MAACRHASPFGPTAYSFDKAIPFHLSYRTLASHGDELRTRRIVLTHFGGDALEHLDEMELERASDGLRIGL